MSVVSDAGGLETKGGQGVGEGGEITAGCFQEVHRERYWSMGERGGGKGRG